MLKFRPDQKMKIIRKKKVLEEYDGKTVKKVGEEYLKTFWLVCEEEDYKERFNTDSAPKWVMKHFKDIVG